MKLHKSQETGLVAIGMMTVFLHFTGHSAPGQDLDPDGWQLSVTPYFWFSGIEGDVKIGGNKADVDVGFDDIWDDQELPLSQDKARVTVPAKTPAQGKLS